MTTIDPSTNLGKLRLRLGDFLDIQQLPDAVYNQVILDHTDTNGNVNLRECAMLCGSYILASLAFSVHSKMQLLEVYGSEAFNNYKSYLMMVTKDPSFNQVSPIPYVAGADDIHPILQFKDDWINAYNKPTSDQRLHNLASGQFDPFSGSWVNG